MLSRLKRFFVWYWSEQWYWVKGWRGVRFLIDYLTKPEIVDEGQKDRYLRFILADAPLSIMFVILFWTVWLLFGLF